MALSVSICQTRLPRQFPFWNWAVVHRTKKKTHSFLGHFKKERTRQARIQCIFWCTRIIILEHVYSGGVIATAKVSHQPMAVSYSVLSLQYIYFIIFSQSMYASAKWLWIPSQLTRSCSAEIQTEPVKSGKRASILSLGKVRVCQKSRRKWGIVVPCSNAHCKFLLTFSFYYCFASQLWHSQLQSPTPCSYCLHQPSSYGKNGQSILV